MAGTQSIVDLLIRVSDQATGPTRNIEASFSGLKSSAMAAAAATAAIGASVLAVAKQAVDLGSKFEDTAINIAGNIRAFELAPTFDAATKSAANALDTIEAMAAKLPGETDQYVEVFKVALPKAIESGMSDIKAITDLTSRFTAVAVSGGVEAGQAGMDMFRMLAGQAGADVRMFTMLAPHLKTTAAEFNKLTIEARRLAIDKALGNFSEMMEAAGNTFSSKMGEAQSHLKTLVRLGGAPIFALAVEQLSAMNGYLSENKQRITEMARVVSDKLSAAFQKVVPIAGRLFGSALDALPKVADFMQSLVDNAEGIETAMTAAVGIWLAASTFNGITALLKLFQAMAAAAVVIEGAAITSAGAAGTAGAVGVTGLSGGAIVGGLGLSVAKMLTMAGTLAAGSFAYALHGTLAEEVDMKEYLKKLQAGSEEGLKNLRPTTVEDWNAAAAAIKTVAAKPKLPGGPKKADVIIENARFDIKQSFAEGYDPDRIAAAFVEQIGSTALYPGQSGFASAGTGAA